MRKFEIIAFITDDRFPINNVKLYCHKKNANEAFKYFKKVFPKSVIFSVEPA